jgi:glycosyltransferase involved in cell wall biosynthesis
MMTQNRLLETRHAIDVAQPHVDNVVIVDGGSVDDSIFYLRNRGGVDLFIHPWRDNFSEQRNNYLARARQVCGQDRFWVIAVDPDEWIEEEAFRNIRQIAERAEADGKNMVTFQCRSVSLKGDERVHQNLDQYWKGLMFLYEPGTMYGGNPHETLHLNGGHRPIRSGYIYEHVKQQNVIWHRGMRNMYIGGGGPNLGGKNQLWVELKRIVSDVYGRDLLWHEFDRELLKGNIDQRIKDWFIKVRTENGWDGSSEHREAYKTYFRIYHPEEEPQELRDEHIP